MLSEWPVVRNKAIPATGCTVSPGFEKHVLNDTDQLVTSELVPTGYESMLLLRANQKREGGIAIVFSSGLSVKVSELKKTVV